MRLLLRRIDLEAIGEEPERFGKALRNPDNIDFPQGGSGSFNLPTPLPWVVHVDAAGGKKERLHAVASNGDLLGYLDQCRQRVVVEALGLSFSGALGMRVKMPQRAHQLGLGLAQYRQNRMAVGEAQGVFCGHMPGDQVMAPDAAFVAPHLPVEAAGVGWHKAALVVLGKPVLEACAARLKYV